MKAESDHYAWRASDTQRTIARFQARSGEWISWREFSQIASWRTRISDARKKLNADGLTIKWNGHKRYSCYRLEPLRCVHCGHADPLALVCPSCGGQFGVAPETAPTVTTPEPHEPKEQRLF